APTGSAAPAPGGFGTADLRRLWPDVLEDVKQRRRVTWILLSQNAQVVEVRDGVLTLGLSNQGARENFVRGTHADLLRAALQHVVGVALHVDPIVDAGATPPASRPASQAAPSPEPPSERSAAAQSARDNLHVHTSPVTPDEPPAEPSRDDDTVDDESSGDDLLRRHLGAELIAEDE
ncbi:MAG: DNA polymerase III subunit gamma and tau, partial [Propionicimonas sp.]|nr:DNA polymerase III subunit gamma and tau [Propionicimonas sp.]